MQAHQYSAASDPALIARVADVFETIEACVYHKMPLPMQPEKQALREAYLADKNRECDELLSCARLSNDEFIRVLDGANALIVERRVERVRVFLFKKGVQQG